MQDDDSGRRFKFNEAVMDRCIPTNYLNNILFSTSHLFVSVALLISNIIVIGRKIKQPKKGSVWCGIIAHRNLEHNFNTERYLHFRIIGLIPSLAIKFPNDNYPDIPHE